MADREGCVVAFVPIRELPGDVKSEINSVARKIKKWGSEEGEKWKRHSGDDSP